MEFSAGSVDNRNIYLCLEDARERMDAPPERGNGEGWILRAGGTDSPMDRGYRNGTVGISDKEETMMETIQNTSFHI